MWCACNISMMKITLLLIGFVQIASVWHVLPIQSCDNLRMFNDDEQVMNFACNDYNGSDSCREGPHGFPSNLSQDQSVGKPRETRVSVFRRNFSNTGEKYRATGLTFEWKVPAEGVSRRSTKGYYIRMQKANSGHVECRLFDLQSEPLSSPKIRFIYEFFPFNNTRPETYLIKIFSLPPPDDLEYEEELYAEHVVTVPKRLDFRQKTYPTHWRTWIRVRQNPEEGRLQVQFGLPERGSLANFTSFHISLISRHSSKSLGRVVYRTNGSEASGRHAFSNVPTGTYKITVVPDNEGCRCWEPSTLHGIDCSFCDSSSTAYFNFTRNKDKIPVTESSTKLPNSGGSDGIPSDGIVAIVLPTCLACLVFLLGVCVIVWWRKKSRQRHRDSRNGISHHGAVYHSVSSKVPQMRKKTVFLLASGDHECYKKAVEMFTRFLQLHCCCDVMVDPLQMRGMQKTASTYADSADFFIIVLSKGASCLYSAFLKGQAYTEADLEPEGDLFTPGIRSICEKMARKENVENHVLMVRFDHTSPGDCLPLATLTPPVYHLPTQLPSFLKRIHGLEGRPWDPSHMSLPLEGDVEELTAGKEWLAAVRDSMIFERQHPEWFVRKFDKPQHELQPPLAHTELGLDYYRLDSGVAGLETTSSCLHQWPHCCSHVQHTEEERSICDETEDGYIHKSDFIAPSVLLFDTVSATTVPYSAYMTRARPAEIDSVSSITEQFDQLNERYEQRQQDSFNNTNTALEQCMPDLNRPKYDDNVQAFPCVFSTDSKVLQGCGEPDSVSQLSIQSA